MSASFAANLVLLLASATPQGNPVPGMPWAAVPDDGLNETLLERLTGIPEDELEVEPVWDGNRQLTRDSFAKSILDQLHIPDPVPALAYESSPGVLFVAMGGVTLRPTCGNGDTANAALNCSPLVSKETTFPPYGNAAQKAAVLQELQAFYEPFNVVLTDERPPDFLPYTMAIVGGTSESAGFVGSTCGVANVACHGLKRNHVSLNFAGSCPDGVAEIVAQESGHNWGLEHTSNTADLLYPFVTGVVQSFVDNCMTISHATSQQKVTQCRSAHANHCPDGAGEEQNSYAELMGVFGPREVDTQAPVIAEIWPEDGATFSSQDKWSVGARISDNSNFLGIKWTLVESPSGEAGYSRCTNKVCDTDYNTGPSFDPAEHNWDFLNISGAPAGTFTFKLEVMDSYLNRTSKTITVQVVDEPGAAVGETEEGGTGGGPLGTTGAEEMATDDAGVDDMGGTSSCSTQPRRDLPFVLLTGLFIAALGRRRKSPRAR